MTGAAQMLAAAWPAIAGLCLFLAVQLLALRVVRRWAASLAGILTLGILSYLTCLVTIHVLWYPALFEHLWSSAPVFAFLIMLYLHFYVGIDRSVSIRILGELVQSGDGRLALEELDAVYSGEEMLRHRVELLVQRRWLIREDGLCRCSAKARRLVRMSRCLQRLYGIDISG